MLTCSPRPGNEGLEATLTNEWLSLRLLKAYGLPVADARIATFG